MTAGVAIRCSACGAPTPARTDSSRQRCAFCGSEFYYQATHEASGRIERDVAARLAVLQPVLDALDAEARGLAKAGDRDGALAKVEENIRHVADVYAQTGRFRIMGLDTPEAIEKNLNLMRSMHLAQLGLEEASAITRAHQGAPGYDRMLRGITERAFDDALGGYIEMIRATPATELVYNNYIRTFALSLTWATLDDYARHGIKVARPTPRADGAHQVTCVSCGAEVVLPKLSESVQCSYCSATFRVRLEGLDVYHALGHTEVTQADADLQNTAVAASRSSPKALLELARHQIEAHKAPPGSERENVLLFAYAMQMGIPPAEDVRAKMATDLGLGAPGSCRHCSALIALGPKSPLKCPICTERL